MSYDAEYDEAVVKTLGASPARERGSDPGSPPAFRGLRHNKGASDFRMLEGGFCSIWDGNP